MKKSTKKLMTGITGAAMLASGMAQTAVAETPAAVVQEAATDYVKVANVEGTFSFNQNIKTPADDVFNIFGTAVTGICAKPDFALTSLDKEYYVNVGGKIAYSYSRDLKSMASERRTMLCACATGPATAQASVTGVSLENVLDLSALAEDANVLQVTSSDGYKQKFSLSYLLEKKAMLAYQIDETAIPTGAQLWIPETVAKYFVRDVVDLEVLAEAETPTLDARNDELRAEIALVNTVEDKFAVGKTLTFQGYADDLQDPIAAVEFSLDGGATWTAYETANASPDLWVFWSFNYTPQTAGTYELSVRARTQSGTVSPLAANVIFEVEA